MELFNIICGLCSIVSLGLSLFATCKVVRISKNNRYSTCDDHSRVVNGGRGNTYNGSYAGRDIINEAESDKQE